MIILKAMSSLLSIDYIKNIIKNIIKQKMNILDLIDIDLLNLVLILKSSKGEYKQSNNNIFNLPIFSYKIKIIDSF